VSEDVFPDRSMEHADKIAWMIETKGWAVEPVPPRPDADPPTPGYAYTIGLESTYGFPEVVLFGLTPVAATGLAELLIEQVAGGVEIPIGVVFTGLLDNDLRCALLPIELDTYAELFTAAIDWHKQADFRMLQLAWPDRNGWLPWESGFEHRLLFAQPVVGAVPGE
jgi:Domain of unknown function (DUF4262)